MSLCVLGIHALELKKDPSNAVRKFLKISVRPREAARREHTFYVTDVAVVWYSAIDPLKAEDMQINRRQMDFMNIRTGMAGTFFVVLEISSTVHPSILRDDSDPPVQNIAPFGFPCSDELPAYEADWKDTLMKLLNEGIVL